ncbi:hypothetical protein RSK20926_19812 [Roseobacter sp. SK209-2-6]|nr:hypothetical protein RSK20926_19812 [Roseobacter sp. SK209-2-6]
MFRFTGGCCEIGASCEGKASVDCADKTTGVKRLAPNPKRVERRLSLFRDIEAPISFVADLTLQIAAPALKIQGAYRSQARGRADFFLLIFSETNLKGRQ